MQFSALFVQFMTFENTNIGDFAYDCVTLKSENMKWPDSLMIFWLLASYKLFDWHVYLLMFTFNERIYDNIRSVQKNAFGFRNLHTINIFYKSIVCIKFWSKTETRYS